MAADSGRRPHCFVMITYRNQNAWFIKPIYHAKRFLSPASLRDQIVRMDSTQGRNEVIGTICYSCREAWQEQSSLEQLSGTATPSMYSGPFSESCSGIKHSSQHLLLFIGLGLNYFFISHFKYVWLTRIELTFYTFDNPITH